MSPIVTTLEPVPVTWSRVVRFWWSFAWRATIYSLLLGLGLGAAAALGAALSGGNSADVAPIVGTVGSLGSLPMTLVAVKQALGKTYRDFEVRLVREIPQQTDSEADPGASREG